MISAFVAGSDAPMNCLSLNRLPQCLWVCLLLGGAITVVSAGDERQGATGALAGVAENEALKRAQATREADMAIIRARELATEGKIAEALDLLAGVREGLPESPLTIPTRSAARDAFSTIATEEAAVMGSEGRYEQANQLLERVLAPEMNPDYLPAQALKKNLADPVKFPPARSPELAQKQAKVAELLRLAESHLLLARYDQANAVYADVLRIDPYNVAARKGMESAERAIMEYALAAKDHTRARMLGDVSAAWEVDRPSTNAASLAADADALLVDAEARGRRELLGQKLKRLMIDSIAIEGVDIRDAIQSVVAKSRAADTTAQAGETRGIDIVLKIGSPDEPFYQQTITREINLRLTDVPLDALVNYLAESAGLAVRIEPFAVVLVPPASLDTAMFLRTYTVAPDFISSVPNNPDAGGDDPFAGNNGNQGGLALRRLSPKEFLEQSGITFPADAFVVFDQRTCVLSMRNTSTNHQTLEAMVEQSRTNVTPQVTIEAKMMEVQEDVINELGFDWLLGIFSSDNGVGVSGGADSDFINNNSFPFQEPGVTPIPVGRNPVTSGNRSGDTALTSRTLERLLAGRDSFKLSQATRRAPGVLSMAGVLTEPRFQMVIRALSQKKGTDFLNAPMVTTRSGLPARIDVVRDFIYPTEFDPPELPNTVGSGTTSTPVTPAFPAAFDVKQVGSMLEVEPVVSADKSVVEVNLDLLHREFVGFVNYGTPITQNLGPDPDDRIVISDNRILQPVFETRSLKNSVSVYNGQTLVVGGILTDNAQIVNDKVPLLGDIPMLGRFFKSNVNEKARRVMLIFLTVKTLDPSGRPMNETVVHETPGE